MANNPIAPRIIHGASRACAACSLRGSARKVMPKALTKQAAASPLVNASAAIDSANSRLVPGAEIWKLSRSD